MKKVMLYIAVLAVTSVGVSAQEGDFCVADFVQPANCVANDVRIEEFTVVEILEDCLEGVEGEAEMILEVLVSSEGSPDRYDVGFFVALDGGSALDGDNCLHSYLAPPLDPEPDYGDANSDGIDDILNGPWWDADEDQCGDIRGDSQVISDDVQVRFACADLDDDGFVEVNACASWDLPNRNATCNGVEDAFPGTPSKCGCTMVEVDIPIPVELESFSIE